MNINRKSISKLIEEYENHSFYERYNFILKSKITYYIWQENFTDLIKLINKYEKETISRNKKFQNKTLSRVRSRNYFIKFIKLFHNYVAAAYLIEEQYKDFLFVGANQNIKNKFEKIFDEPLRLFIFALRNNITHHTIPPISISIHHKKGISNMGDTIFIAKGAFQVNKNKILSDLDNKDSKFLGGSTKNRDKLRSILRSYLASQHRGKLSIDLEGVIKKHHGITLKYKRTADHQIVALDKDGYREIERLHKTIIHKQSKI